MEPRSIIRWQHRLKREHPTGTEISVLEECGWKGGAVEERLLVPSDYAVIILVDQAGHCSWAIRDRRRPR